MIGVAFAMEKTFGIASDIEGVAFVRTLREFTQRRQGKIDAVADETTVTHVARISSITELHEAFSTALRPHLLNEAERLELEAGFRMQAARLVRDRFEPFADVASTLQELAGLNVPCVALTGGWPSIDLRKAQMVGFTSPIIFAHDIGVPAHSPTAFARVADSLRLPADRIWFVGTELCSEILPAGAAGMRTIWLDRDAETFPPGRTPPDAIVASFGDVLDVLSESYTRGLLALRHILRTTLDWRPGHFRVGDDDAKL